MERKKFLKSLALVGAAGTVLASCGNADKEMKNMGTNDGFKTGFIFHSVYFWLKDDIQEKEENDFLNFFELLKKVPGVEACYVGKPAATNPRPVVDNSFSYHIMLTFSSLEATAIYEDHPDHLAAVEQYSKYWKQVEVRDTVLS